MPYLVECSIRIMLSSKILVIQPTNHNQSSVKECAEIFRSGGVVVVPTETVYGVAALLSDGNAIQKLLQAKNRPTSHTLAIAVHDWQMALRYTEESNRLAAKLARLYWPGPLTLVLDAGNSASKIPEESRAAVAPANAIGFRSPQNAFLLDVLHELDEPVVLTSANISGQPPARSASEALVSLADKVDLIVDGGPSQLGAPSTVVKITADKFEILRKGEISYAAIRDATVKTVLFVCTGNKCRSPIAEALCQKLVSEHIGRARANQYRFLSAGTDASTGDPATPYSCETLLRDYNISLDGWRSRKINYRLLDEADVIFCMNQSHLVALCNAYPDCAERVCMLKLDGSDIIEPSCESIDAYRICARQIEEALRQRIEDILKP